MNVIECKQFTKIYGGTKALDEISFTIEENKITGLIGRNGAGKTTLLKAIVGYIHETSGHLHVIGERPFNNLNVSANSIFIDDQMSLPASLNLAEILQEAKRFYENWDDELAQGLFQYFSFNPSQRHASLSKGKKSTFNVIIGLAARCAITIFDEPTTGMDASVRKDFYRALLKEYLAHPRTIIISSHHLEEMEDLLEDVLLVKNGTTKLHMPIADLKEYAVGVTGQTAAIHAWSQTKEVIFEKETVPGTTYVVVRNDETIIDSELRQAGFDTTSVRPSDLCVYLTNETKGGIDDVFNRN